MAYKTVQKICLFLKMIASVLLQQGSILNWVKKYGDSEFLGFQFCLEER